MLDRRDVLPSVLRGQDVVLDFDGAAICCLAIEKEYLPPTLNLEKPDNDLDCIPKVGRRARVDYVLSNSFGFGGINASLVLARQNVTNPE